MDNENIRILLTRLKRELESSGYVDSDTLEMLDTLDKKISGLPGQHEPAEEEENLLDYLQSLEAEFAVKHPVAESTFREIIAILGRMGI